MSKIDIKVVLLGRESVGKSCLMERFLYGKFNIDSQATVGAAFGAKKLILQKEDGSSDSVTLGIWDTAGAERYESMSKIYYREAGAGIVCFDVTRKESWEKVEFWVDELLNNQPGCQLYIVGTKVDLLEDQSRAVPANEVQSFVSRLKALYFETSAKTGFNTDDVFYAIAKQCLKEKREPPMKNGIVLRDGAVAPTQKKGCCT